MRSRICNKVREISADLVRSYRDAQYVIHGDFGDTTLKVDECSPKLCELMKIHDVKSAAFLTAFNPYSVLLSPEKNTKNHNALIADISSLKLKQISGEGGDPSEDWPKELSILVLGITLQDAECLADRYRQNAFLWITSDDGIVRLNLRFSVGG